MKNLFLKVAFWLLKKYAVKFTIIPESLYKIVDTVRVEVNRTSQMEGLLSNEYRHAHTYATLCKRLPEVPSRDIGLCIEMVIYGLL